MLIVWSRESIGVSQAVRFGGYNGDGIHGKTGGFELVIIQSFNRIDHTNQGRRKITDRKTDMSTLGRLKNAFAEQQLIIVRI